MTHIRYNSQTPLTGGPKIPLIDKRAFRLKQLTDDGELHPLIQKVASDLSFNYTRGAKLKLKESVQVRQDNKKLFYSLLFVYILADEERDELLRNSSPLVNFDSISLERYDQQGRLPVRQTNQEFQYLQPQLFHKAVKALDNFQNSYIRKEILALTDYYKSLASIDRISGDVPQLSNLTYQKLRTEILKHSLRSAIQLNDKSFINFLTQNETSNLSVTPDICLALYHQSCFDALWAYSRCKIIAHQGRYLSKRVLSRFHKLERNHKSTRIAYETVISEHPNCKQNLHNYLEILLRSREHCLYLRRDYMQEGNESNAGGQMASFYSNESSKNIAIESRNNLPRSNTSIGLKASPRLRSPREGLLFQPEERNDEAETGLSEQNKRRWNSSLFEVSMIGKFIHYLLSLDEVRESEQKAQKSKIVCFLRHVRLCFRIQDESVLRILISMGYENEALYLIQAQEFQVSPEVYITAIHCQAFILTLLLEGGTPFIQQSTNVVKRKYKSGQEEDKDQKQEQLVHPVSGYFLKMYSVYNEFNEVMLLKLKTRPQYMEILLFIWKRQIQYIDHDIAQSILKEIEAQLDFAITSQNSYGGYLRFVSNPLKICLLQIEFIELLASIHPELLSKTTDLVKSFYEFSLRLQSLIGAEGDGIVEDSMRYILEDRDLEGRSVMKLITQDSSLIDLVNHPTVKSKTVEVWEGPFKVDRSLIPPSLRTVNSLLTRSSAIPLFLKCTCCKRKSQRSRLKDHQIPSKKGSQISLGTRRSSIDYEMPINQDGSNQFKIGVFSASDETRQFHRSQVSIYQYESWREGQLLRYCQSYVFEFIIFVMLHYYLLLAVSKNRSLGGLLPLEQTTPAYLQSYLNNLQIFDMYVFAIISICLMFWGIPVHYILVIVFRRVARKEGLSLSKIAQAIDFFIFAVVFLGTVLIFSSFYSLSSQLQTLKPEQINLATLSYYHSQIKSYKDSVDRPQLWSYLALVIALIWFQYVISLRVILSIGSLFKVLKMNSRDFIIWLLMFSITLAMFSIAGFNLSVQEITHTCRTFKLCLIMFFQASLGQISFAEQVHVNSAEIILILCLIVNMVLLLTILVAMFNQSYNKIIEKANLFQMTDLYNIGVDSQLNSNYGAFLALDYPLSVFPGALILGLLYCCNKRKPRDKYHKRQIQRQNQALNDLIVRLTSYSFFWLGVSLIVLVFNIALTPFIYICLVINEFKLLCSASITKVKRASYISDAQGEALKPQIISPQKKRAQKRRQCRKLKHCFKTSIWIWIFGFPILVLQTLVESVRFTCSLCKSQKSLLKNKNPSIENYERHRMQYSFDVKPEAIATLATLAYEEIQEAQEKDPVTQQKPKDIIDNFLRIRGSSKARPSLKPANTFKQRLDASTQKSSKNDQVVNFGFFFKKVVGQLKEKARLQNQDSFAMVPRPSRHSLSRNENFYSNNNVVARPREAQNVGKRELNDTEIIARLLIHFSIKKEEMGLVSSQASALLKLKKFLNREIPEISGLEIYLDCFVGVFSNLLIYSKLHRFTRNPYKIPPSRRSTDPRLMSSSDFLSRIVTINPGEEQPNEGNIAKLCHSFIQEGQQPSNSWIEEASLIKTKQIETLFFIYNLEQLIQALHSFKSKGYRLKNSMGELLKHSTDISNISKKLIERNQEEKTLFPEEDSEGIKSLYSDTSRSLSFGRLSTDRSITSPLKVQRKSHFFKPEKTVQFVAKPLETDGEPVIQSESSEEDEQVLPQQTSLNSAEAKNSISLSEKEDEEEEIEKFVAEYEQRQEEESAQESQEEEEEENISKRKPLLAWKTQENWNNSE